MNIQDGIIAEQKRQREIQDDDEILTSISEKAVRNAFSDEEIVEITDYAVQHVQADAVRWWNMAHPSKSVSKQAVSKYVSYYKATGTYWHTLKRGPKYLISYEEEERVARLFDRVREKGLAVCSTTFSAITRGVLRKMRGDGSVEPVPGLHVFSTNWARETMKRLGLRVRHATTDRTVPTSSVILAGEAFFDELEKLNCLGCFVPELVLNVDEFFVRLSPGAQWTWERVRVGERKNVSIKDDHAGFTCSVVTSMAGELVCFQMIWEGKTDVHARVSAQPKIFQQHREGTHFQSAETWKVFLDHIEKSVLPARERVQERESMENLPPWLLFIDAAPQHVKVQKEDLYYVDIPSKMTHVFQPADQYIIANIKQGANAYYHRWMEEVVRMYDDDVAALILSGDLVPPDVNGGAPAWNKLAFKRAKKYEGLAAAVDVCSSAVIAKSWERTGIPRALTGIYAPAVFDEYAALSETVIVLEELEALGRNEEAKTQAAAARDAGARAAVARAPVTQPQVKQMAQVPQPPGVKKSVGRPKAVPDLTGLRDIRAFFKKGNGAE